jgi:hypothetical protein
LNNMHTGCIAAAKHTSHMPTHRANVHTHAGAANYQVLNHDEQRQQCWWNLETTSLNS